MIVSEKVCSKILAKQNARFLQFCKKCRILKYCIYVNTIKECRLKLEGHNLNYLPS